MQYANLTNLIKNILIIVFIWYAVKFLFRLFFPVLVKAAVNKAGQNFQQQQQQYQQRSQNQTQDFTAPTVNSDKPREKKKVGEYIDFEELD